MELVAIGLNHGIGFWFSVKISSRDVSRDQSWSFQKSVDFLAFQSQKWTDFEQAPEQE